MLAIVSIKKSVGSNILLKFVRKGYAAISFANSRILNHVNMEKNVISCKWIVVFNHKVSGQNKIKEAEKLEKQVKKLELDADNYIWWFSKIVQILPIFDQIKDKIAI